MTVDAIVKSLAIQNLDYMVCYQSRVGPVEWLKPYTDHVITEFSAQGRPIVVVPVAFVSEHSETLVELDIEYRDLALKNGASSYANRWNLRWFCRRLGCFSQKIVGEKLGDFLCGI